MDHMNDTEAFNKISEEGVFIYAFDAFNMSVCAPKAMTQEEVTVVVNRNWPTHIDVDWAVDPNGFADGSPNGVECKDDPRKAHYLYCC